jgi:hypothetical protein
VKPPACSILNAIGEMMTVREHEFVRVRHGRSHSRRAFIARIEIEGEDVRIIGNVSSVRGEWAQPRTIRPSEILCND